MNAGFAFMPLLLVVAAALLLLALGLALVIVLLRKPRGHAGSASSAGVHASAPARRAGPDRREVLAKLAAKEISRDEAERLLNERGAPLPETLPPPPAQSTGIGRGCLIAVIVAVLLFVVLVCGVLGLRLVGHSSGRRIRLSTGQAVPVQVSRFGSSGGAR